MYELGGRLLNYKRKMNAFYKRADDRNAYRKGWGPLTCVDDKILYRDASFCEH